MNKLVIAVSLICTAAVAGACSGGGELAEMEQTAPLEEALVEANAVAPAAVGARFGTYCQQDFQSGWQNTLPESWNRCGWFNDELDDTDTKIFYWNMQGAESYFEQANDQVYIENVNLLYSNTHGGAWTGTAVLAMWDNGSLASTSEMRLGDESYGLSLWGNYSCETLKHADAWTNWSGVFKGGFRAVAGSHGTVWSGSTTNEVGEDFADELQGSAAFRYAWRDGISDWNTDQDATVMYSGTDGTDCSNRRSGMKWQNYTSYARRMDNNVGSLCWTYWDNL